MFGIGGFELIIILIVGFILVGDRLPDVAKTLGRALRTFQNAQKDMNEVIKNDVFDPEADEPFKDPLNALDKMGDVAKKAGTSLAGDFSEIKKTASKKPGASAANQAKSADKSGATATGATATAASAAAATAGSVKRTSGESFAERRARYEKQRAERLAAEAQEKAAAENAASGTPEQVSVVEPAASNQPASAVATADTAEATGAVEVAVTETGKEE